MHECTPRCQAVKLAVLGIILLLARIYTTWDIWIVIGVLLIIRAILTLIIPVCPCQKSTDNK